MNQNKYIPGHGSLSAQLMVIGDAPTYNEIESGLSFSGSSGKQLDSLLRDCGISRSEIWTTTVSKYFVPSSPKTSNKKIPFKVRAKQVGVDIDQQVMELQQEINDINPNCLLLLGGSTLEALTSRKTIQDYRGSIIQACGKKAVSTYHPNNLINLGDIEISGYWARWLMQLDTIRAKQQSSFPEFRLPYRNLQVCKSSAQLADFYERLKVQRGNGRIKLAVDIEAHDCIPICIGLAFNHHEGLTVPLWNVKNISTIPDADLVSIWILLSKILMDEKIDIVGQNFKYDEDKLTRLGLPIWRLASDTMLKAFAINPELPVNLACITSIYTEEPFYKNEGMYEGSMQDLFIGCARDACVTLEDDDKMDPDVDALGVRKFYENFLMQLHSLYLGIEQEGFKVNETKREELLKKYITWDEQISYELFQIVGAPINSSSWKQVQILLYHNWNLPGSGSTSEEVLTALLNQKHGVKNPEHRRGIELILEQRRVRKTISTYGMALPDYDGRMRTTYFLCLETGRTSTGQQDPPIRPTFEYKDFNGKKKKKSLGTAFQVMTKHGDIGQDIRSIYEADEGEIFIQADSAQAEARVVSLLAEDYEALKMYDEPGRDVHALTASWFFGGKEEDYSKKILGYETPKRFAGKTLKHAGNLGTGKKRAAIEVNTQARKYKINFQISEWEAQRALEIFHQKSPNIRNVFHKGIVQVLEKGRRLIAPLPYGIDAPHGGVRIFYERWGEELNRQAFAYLPQRAISDNTKAAALRIKARAYWIRIILESHDSLLCSVPINRLNEAGRIITEEMQRPIDFTQCSLPRGFLTVPCELETGFNYMELSKFKYEVAA